jgi:hypothetical protein
LIDKICPIGEKRTEWGIFFYMGLLEQARADARKILGDLAGWATMLTFTSPMGEITTINGTFFKRTIPVMGGDGTPMNARHIHITFAEAEMIESYYEIRNDAGKVDLKDHLVSCADSTGVTHTYIIREWHPDETLGIVRCMVGDYAP